MIAKPCSHSTISPPNTGNTKGPRTRSRAPLPPCGTARSARKAASRIRRRSRWCSSWWMRRRKAGAGSMVTTSCPSSFKASGSPTASKLPRTRRPRNPKPPPPEPSGHHQNSAIARGHRVFGLQIVERDSRWHVHGTVVVRNRRRRVRKSTGLSATVENLDAAQEIRRQIEAQTRDELIFGFAASVSVVIATNAYVARPRQRPLNAGDVDRLSEIAKVFGNRLLNRIDDREWAEWIERRMKGNAPATRERYIDLLIAFLTWCRKRPRQWIVDLPAIERDRAARQR